MTAERTLAERIGDVLRSLTGDAPLPALAETGDPAAGEPNRFDDAVRMVSESMDHWRGGRSLIRFVQESGRDRIAALGHEVELAVKVEALYRGGPDLADRTVRFAIGDEIVGEARTDEHGMARLRYVPTAPGLHHVRYEVLNDRGRVLRPLEAGERGLLQVVTEEPVAAVDAAGLFDRGSEALEPLRELGRLGWQLCYVDFHELDRTLEIHEILERMDLPHGATLVHSAEDVGFATMKVDFVPMFAASFLRRIRALGVPAVLAVGEEARLAAFGGVEGLTAMTFEALAEAAPEHAAIDSLAARAGAFVKARDAADVSQRFTRGLDLMTESRLIEGNWLRFEEDNAAAREAVLGAVERAQRSVHVQFYIVRDGWFSEHLAVRLVGAARRGVQVRIVVDALYSGEGLLGLQNPMARALRGEPGIEVLASDPISFGEKIDAVTLKQRDHRKLVIVDGETAFVTGRNAGDEYYDGFTEVPILDSTPHERIPWLDAHLEVRGPVVADVQRVFLGNWKRNSGPEIVEDDAVLPTLERQGLSRSRVIHHDGLGDANALLSYEAIIQGARDHLYVVNDFPVLATLAALLLRAVQRGVRVEFLTGCAVARRADGSFFKGPLHRELFEYMTKRRFEPLMRGGVLVHEYQVVGLPNIVARGGIVRPYVHAKVMTADGEVVSVGSANLDATAAYWEREVNLVVEDPAVARAVEERIEGMIERSIPLDVESDYWKREAARRAITDTLWPDVMYS